MSIYNEKAREYRYQYEKEKLKRIPLDVQLPEYDQIKSAATNAGMTVNGFVKHCIREKLDSLQQSGIIPIDRDSDSNNE